VGRVTKKTTSGGTSLYLPRLSNGLRTAKLVLPGLRNSVNPPSFSPTGKPVAVSAMGCVALTLPATPGQAYPQRLVLHQGPTGKLR